MDRLGVGWDVLHKVNPRLIYSGLTGYGRAGKYSTLAGHDINYLALSGVLDLDRPRRRTSRARRNPDRGLGRRIDAGGDRYSAGAGGAASDGTGPASRRFHVRWIGGAAPRAYFFDAGGKNAGAGQRSAQRAIRLLSRLCRGRGIVHTVGALETKFWQNLCRELDCSDLIADQYADEPRQSEIKRKLARFSLKIVS